MGMQSRLIPEEAIENSWFRPQVVKHYNIIEKIINSVTTFINTKIYKSIQSHNINNFNNEVKTFWRTIQK